jgi:hypothetical protein
MSPAKLGSKRKQRRKAAAALGVAAGLSLSLASRASAAIDGPAADMTTRNPEVSYEITLGEEEIADVSLATFYVFDKENAGTFTSGARLAAGGGCGGCAGCATDTDYGTSTLGSAAANPRYYSIKPAHKYTHAPKRTHVPKSPGDSRG